MAPFRNKGWLFYSEMVALCPDSAGAMGSHSYLSNKEETLDQGLDQVQPPYSAESSLIPTGWEGSTTSGNPLDCDINIDQLFQLGHDLTSSSISTQLSTVHDTLATLGMSPFNTSLPLQVQVPSPFPQAVRGLHLRLHLMLWPLPLLALVLSRLGGYQKGKLEHRLLQPRPRLRHSALRLLSVNDKTRSLKARLC